MDSDLWPDGEPLTAEQVADTVREIDACTAETKEALLDAFLCAAWPTRQGQEQ